LTVFLNGCGAVSSTISGATRQAEYFAKKAKHLGKW